MVIMTAIDIVILSNGPGELATWVRPVVRALRQQLGDRLTRRGFPVPIQAFWWLE
ncbi:hypothetical protein J0895_21700 [Phormidium pseudopriestleyi FRX01]|uniref:Uncharacterized protein n=1 Tax=Phormidium pseudopriestleyi FRX01 TaxID=1759528 RepID=A0ABS3FWY6_9CYAN|nr:hypothetical protein [Phormidium pseudopriestleyi]MBO0351648.1 hypothetical protein [Phormidium pseudopriestleyi FRX01]